MTADTRAAIHTAEPLILGVDAGRTKTIALLARTDGTIIGAGRGGCGDIYVDATLSAVDEALTMALNAASVHIQSVRAAVFSMGGADWPEDFVYIQDAMQTRLGCPLWVVNDAIGALRVGSPDGTGISVVCGTGTATGARNANGELWHSSFWQETHGSHQLAEKMLSAVYRADLEIAPPTALTQAALDFYAMPDVTELLHLFTARVTPPPAHRGRLVRVLLDIAEQGDPVACAIVREHGTDLGAYALAAARKVRLTAMQPIPLVLTGSVLRHSTHLLADALIKRVRAELPHVQPTFSTHQPVIGALLLALDHLEIASTDAIQARLAETVPPASLFVT